MRHQISGVVPHADRRDTRDVCQDEIRALLLEPWLPLSNGIEWIIERMEARGREAT
ncbi:hypothetical protein LA6_004710 [Marinibacterium anthonyi]|nr:hypothetical protein LA6_004710 [Marinibacterium anthonyi]